MIYRSIDPHSLSQCATNSYKSILNTKQCLDFTQVTMFIYSSFVLFVPMCKKCLEKYEKAHVRQNVDKIWLFFYNKFHTSTLSYESLTFSWAKHENNASKFFFFLYMKSFQMCWIFAFQLNLGSMYARWIPRIQILILKTRFCVQCVCGEESICTYNK